MERSGGAWGHTSAYTQIAKAQDVTKTMEQDQRVMALIEEMLSLHEEIAKKVNSKVNSLERELIELDCKARIAFGDEDCEGAAGLAHHRGEIVDILLVWQSNSVLCKRGIYCLADVLSTLKLIEPIAKWLQSDECDQDPEVIRASLEGYRERFAKMAQELEEIARTSNTLREELSAYEGLTGSAG